MKRSDKVKLTAEILNQFNRFPLVHTKNAPINIIQTESARTILLVKLTASIAYVKIGRPRT